MSSLWLIRHSERLDHVNKKKWRNSYRYKQNKHDTPLSKYGFKIAKKAAKKIYDKEDNIKDIKYIYSSPMTRCIQTSVVLQDYIREKTGHLPLIRIEYALREIYTVSELNYVTLSRGLFKEEINKDTFFYLDDQLRLPNLYKKFRYRFDTTYKPFMSFEDVSLKDKNYRSAYNKIVKTYRHIEKNDKHNKIISCHGGVLIPLHAYLMGKFENDSNFHDKFLDDNYCVLSNFINKKLVYGPTTHFWKK